MKLALAYRQRFGEDVVIDLVCYRRHGHNEGDEPSFTQPLLYRKIRERSRSGSSIPRSSWPWASCATRTSSGSRTDLTAQLRRRHSEMIETRPPGPDEPLRAQRNRGRASIAPTPSEEPDTGVPIEQLAQLAERIAALPPEFPSHPKLAALLERRREGHRREQSGRLGHGGSPRLRLAARARAASVRLSGQDSVRGTFSHRHAGGRPPDDGRGVLPARRTSLPPRRASRPTTRLLSEAAVLGFEYGYSLADPTTLTIWEAQFGDFANGAQVIIDQFVTSAHAKWQRMSGLVMLLPHGYEGQGPEHSSARIERFLQGCAPTTTSRS